MLLISELAARSGFSPSTLRYYEQVGLLTAAERSSGGYRLYDDSALARLRFIVRAKQLGLPLEEIRELVAVWEGGLCAHVQDRLREHITAKSTEVRARVAELTTFATQLDAAHAQLADQSPDGPCTEGCGCGDPGEETASAPELLTLAPTRRLSAQQKTPAAPVDLDAIPVLVACTLAADDKPTRLAEWTQLLALVEHREPLVGGVRLRFPPDPALAGRLAELAAREHSCCSFFTFTLHPASDAVTLDVQAPDDAAAIVLDIFGAPA
jgi:DNA-binding transcriptional MerR regulator